MLNLLLLILQIQTIAQDIESKLTAPTPEMVRNQKVEDQISFLETVSFRYARGCDGQGKCKGKFDCSGIVTESLKKIQAYTGRKLNSNLIWVAWHSVPIMEAKRGDFLWMIATDWSSNHIAVVYEWRSGGKIKIIDFYKSNHAQIRTLTVGKRWKMQNYDVKISRRDYTKPKNFKTVYAICISKNIKCKNS